MPKLALALLLAATTTLCAQQTTPDKPTPAQRTQYIRAACAGKINSKGQCTACLGSGEPGITDIVDAIPGSFTARNQKQLLLITNSMDCESHANNFGGAILLTFRNGAWEKGAYEAGIVGNNFKVVPTPAGHDLLVFQGGFMQSGQASEWIDVLNISSSGAFNSETLLLVNTAGGGPCQPKPEVMHDGQLKKVDVSPGSIHAHVEVTTSRQKGDKDGACVVVPGSSTTVQYNVEYILRDNKFVVAPASAAAAQTLNKLFEH
jgi:hypothetical protein